MRSSIMFWTASMLPMARWPGSIECSPRTSSSFGRPIIPGDAVRCVRPRYTESFRPATLGSTFAAHLARIVWCKECRHQVEPDVPEQVERYGAGLTVLEWAGRDKAKRPLLGGRQVHQRQRRGMGECLASTPILSIWRPRGWPHENDLTPRSLTRV